MGIHGNKNVVGIHGNKNVVGIHGNKNVVGASRSLVVASEQDARTTSTLYNLCNLLLDYFCQII